MKTYGFEVLVPSTVLSTITILAENSSEALKKFKSGDYNIMNEKLVDICYANAELDYFED